MKGPSFTTTTPLPWVRNSIRAPASGVKYRNGHARNLVGGSGKSRYRPF